MSLPLWAVGVCERVSAAVVGRLAAGGRGSEPFCGREKKTLGDLVLSLAGHANFPRLETPEAQTRRRCRAPASSTLVLHALYAADEAGRCGICGLLLCFAWRARNACLCCGAEGYRTVLRLFVAV